MLTTDRSEPLLKEHDSLGMQCAYLVLNEDDIKLGYTVPYCAKYTHLLCGSVTTIAAAIAATYARDPKFYSGTFCCSCGKHYALLTNAKWQFEWSDGRPVGSNNDEANAYLNAKVRLSRQKQAAITNDVDVPLTIQWHIDHWLTVNELTPDKVQWAAFPVGMVQNLIERTE